MRRKYFGFIFIFMLISIVKCSEEDFEEVTSEDQEDKTGNKQPVEEIVFENPKFDPSHFYFVDHFNDVELSERTWVRSQAKKDDTAEEIAKYDGQWKFEAPQRIVWKKDLGLVLKSKAKHSAIAAFLNKPFVFDSSPFVVQYEVTMQDGQECGGSYIKLLSEGKATNDLKKFNDKTPYTIMFGPDKCGNDIKLHFIFRHVNPINGSVEEKHCKKPRERLEEPFKDKLPHLYQLVLKPDNTFQISVDHKVVNEGSLLTDFTPPVNPPKEIDDPTDKKPTVWDEREKIPDPDAHKPDDWDEDAPPQIPDLSVTKPTGWLDDEPEIIPDPKAEKPDDWDAEIDGEWEAPLVENPACEKAPGCGPWKAPLVQNKNYKGKWRAPLIDNPNYQGKWTPRKIPNPDLFEDLHPFKMTAISAIGIELWSISSEILFDNLIITDDIQAANDFAANTFDIKRKFIDKESESFINSILKTPWLWQIIAVLLVTPVSIFVYRKYFARQKESSSTITKQKDALVPDDNETTPHQTENENESVQTELNQSSPKAKKADLEVRDSTENLTSSTADGGSSEGTEDEGQENTNVEPDSSEVEAEIEKEEPPVVPVTEGTRKRKPRKD